MAPRPLPVIRPAMFSYREQWMYTLLIGTLLSRTGRGKA